METTSAKENAEADAVSGFRRMREDAISRFKEQPLLYAGIAVGAGFVLGGGLATTTTLRVLRNSASLILQITVVPYLLTRLREALVESAE